MNKLFKLFSVMVLGVVVGPPLVRYIIAIINTMHNPIYKLLAWSILLIGSVIVFLICIDFVFSSRIAERVIANLVTKILWSFIQFIGKIFVKWYEVTTTGILYLIKLVKGKK